jgi:hypothetical protein
MEAKITTYLNNAKSAFTFVFDDGCYYDSTMDAYEILKEIYESTGIKIKITSAQTVNFISPTLKNMWDSLFAQGYFDLSGHSVSHCIGYNKDTDPQLLDADARETKEKLEKLYNTPVCTFVTPGGGNDTIGCEVLKKYYLGNRNGREEINDTYNMDLYDVGVFIARHVYDFEPYKDIIDKTVECGGWCVQVNHWLSKKEQDTHHAQKYETFKPQCEYLAKHAMDNAVWVCSFNDMIKYVYIRDNSSVAVENGYLFLESDLDKDIFDVPVTVMYGGKCYNVRLGEKCALDA